MIIRKLVDKIRQIINRMYTIVYPAYWVDREIYSALHGKDVQIIGADGFYWIPLRMKDLQKIVQDFANKHYKYIAEKFDCDDFAKQLTCFAIRKYGVTGIFALYDYGMGHAYNITILPPALVLIIEPQTGEIMTVGEAEKKGYLKCPCVVIT